MVFWLLLIYEYYFLKDVNDSFEIRLSNIENVVACTFLDEFNIFLLNFVILIAEREILIALINWLLLFEIEGRQFENGFIIIKRADIRRWGWLFSRRGCGNLHFGESFRGRLLLLRSLSFSYYFKGSGSGRCILSQLFTWSGRLFIGSRATTIGTRLFFIEV